MKEKNGKNKIDGRDFVNLWSAHFPIIQETVSAGFDGICYYNFTLRETAWSN
ncbi:hypothetical protein ACFLTH_04530 [Bacteroidota bacterium]